jgi:hypothetical protein
MPAYFHKHHITTKPTRPSSVLSPLSCCCCQDEEGIDPQRLFPISAVTGRGVRKLVGAVHGVLDELGPAEVAPETNALNLTSVPRRFAPEVRELSYLLGLIAAEG